MLNSLRKTGWSFRAILALFVVAILFQIMPNSHAIVHMVVHEKGIAHTHSDAGEEHSQEDHASGKIHDLFFSPAAVTVQSHTQIASNIFFESCLKVFASSWEMPFQHDPPRLISRGLDLVPRPISTEFPSSHPLRGPPSA